MIELCYFDYLSPYMVDVQWPFYENITNNDKYVDCLVIRDIGSLQLIKLICLISEHKSNL